MKETLIDERESCPSEVFLKTIRAGNSWCDVQSVPNTGNGVSSYIDMGALEFQAPECE